MKKLIIICCVFFISYSLCSQNKYHPYERNYSNEIPSLQIVGVAMSESIENARQIVQQQARENTKLNLDFPILVDYPSSFSGSGISINAAGLGETKNGKKEMKKDPWDTKAAGGFTFSGKVSKQLRIEHEQAITMFIIDRQGRIRAIANTPLMIRAANANKYAELIEYLLINIGGNEALPYEAKNMKYNELKNAIEGNNTDGFHIWEYGEELQRREREKHGDIHVFDKYDLKKFSRVYPMLGEKIQDFSLPAIDGSGNKKFSDLSKNKVTVLIVFWAGGDKDNRKSFFQSSMVLNQLYAIDNLYKDWTLKQAVIGKKTDNFENAQPFTNTNKNIISGYEIDLTKKIISEQPNQTEENKNINKTPPPIPGTVEYYIVKDGKKTGPFNTNTIKQKINNNEITEETLVWKEGMSDWLSAKNITEISKLFVSTPPPIPTTAEEKTETKTPVSEQSDINKNVPPSNTQEKDTVFPSSPTPPQLSKTEPKKAKSKEKNNNRCFLSFLVGSRNYSNSNFGEYNLSSSNLTFGLKFEKRIKCIGLELSVLPSISGESTDFDELDYETTYQKFIPISLSLKFHPSFFKKTFSPYVGFGAGFGIANCKSRMINTEPPPKPEYVTYYFPEGTGLQYNFTFGADINLCKHFALGIDGRFFILKFDENNIYEEDSDNCKYLRDEWRYDNFSIYLSLSYTF